MRRTIPNLPEEAATGLPGEAQEEQEELVATNRAIRLTCTLAAALGLFAIFLCWAEKESRAVRMYAVRSAALTILHLTVGAVLFLLGLLLGGIPYLGYVVQLLGWLGYIVLVLAILVFRIRMMYAAWQGWPFQLPVMDTWLKARFE